MWKIQRPFQINSSPEGVLRISSDRDDRMGAKIKMQKNPLGFKQNHKKSLDQNLSSKKSHAEFTSHNKNFQKAQNDITRKIETLVLNTQKNSYLNQGTNKKYLPKFSYPKNIKI